MREAKPVRPVCQCKARAEAMKRAAAATILGDLEAVAVEKDFIQRSIAEDTQAMKDYAKQVADYYKPEFMRKKWAS